MSARVTVSGIEADEEWPGCCTVRFTCGHGEYWPVESAGRMYTIGQWVECMTCTALERRARTHGL